MAEAIESFRTELRTALNARALKVRTFDGVRYVSTIVPTGLHTELWRCGALVAPGRVALAWVNRASM